MKITGWFRVGDRFARITTILCSWARHFTLMLLLYVCILDSSFLRGANEVEFFIFVKIELPHNPESDLIFLHRTDRTVSVTNIWDHISFSYTFLLAVLDPFTFIFNLVLWFKIKGTVKKVRFGWEIWLQSLVTETVRSRLTVSNT